MTEEEKLKPAAELTTPEPKPDTKTPPSTAEMIICRAAKGWDLCKTQFEKGTGKVCPKCGKEFCCDGCLKNHTARY